MSGLPENHINNYYLLKRLASELDLQSQGSYLEQCYSVNKSEIVFCFSNGDNSYWLKGNFGEQSIVFSPSNVSHKPRDAKNIFQEIENKKVVSCTVHFQDRSFRISFENGFALVFMMYGRNGNVLLFKDNVVEDLFRKQFEKHRDKLLTDFKPDAPPLFEVYDASASSTGILEAVRTSFKGLTLGMISYLEAHDIVSKNIEAQWHLITTLETLLSTGTIDVIKNDKNTFLTLLPTIDLEGLIYSGQDVTEALNQYAKQYFYQKSFNGLKNEKIGSINAKIEKNLRQSDASKQHLQELENNSNYKKMADIIMANLHNIAPEAEKAILFDFYNDTNIEISFKRGISPQSQAEKLYRKSKNQEIEKLKTLERIKNLENEWATLQKELMDIESIIDLKPLKAKAKTMEKEIGDDAPPFRHFTEGDYDIYVGKSATNNDVLTFEFAHKEDLWLHARDVSGSHVIIKHKQNTTFPKPVIQRAAQLAAYYSKSKGSILSPVIYTLRKFVRKPKGAAHGAVVCEKEQMIMVEPGLGVLRD